VASLKEFIKKLTPPWILEIYHFLWAFVGALIYGFPGKKLKIIGITGTNGKTTTTHLLTHILETAGYKVASLSSLRFKLGSREWINELKMTMPGRMNVQRFLYEAVKEKITHIILEVTSEGIKQHRHEFIPFAGAVLTNITKEHLEAHGGFENYKMAKFKLFKAVEKSAVENNFVVVNLDDPAGKEFMNVKVKQKIGYSINKETKSFPDFILQKAENIKQVGSKTLFEVSGIKFQTNLLGHYNVSNVLAAISTAEIIGIDQKTLKTAVEKFIGAPGRLEVVSEKPYKVVVDYAHTPDALEKVYSTLKASGGSLVCVLGSAGGGRDKWKRKELGKIAAQYCRQIIVTNEDPYDENPSDIIDEVAKGAESFGKRAEKVLDRKEAVKLALTLAEKTDTIIITGKGAEPWMVVAQGKKIPWDDRLVVKQLLAKMKNTKQ